MLACVGNLEWLNPGWYYWQTERTDELGEGRSGLHG